jgi:octaprenyl-diphosphate synthase
MTLSSIQKLIKNDLLDLESQIKFRSQTNVELINKLSEHIISGGGKRLRPIVLFLSAHSKESDRKIIDAATVVEFIHAATLLHDDVVDMSQFRHSKETANTIWGNKGAVLVGDFLYSRAFEIIVEINNPVVYETLANTTNIIAQGEVLQLMNVDNINMTEDLYMEIIYRKTAKLFEASAKIGSVIAGHEKKHIDKLAKFGLHFGMAYQLRNDYLDYFGDSVNTGKNLAEDLSEGKATLPIIHSIRKASNTDKLIIKNAFMSNDTSKKDEIISIITKTNSNNYILKIIDNETDAAIKCLSKMENNEFIEGLKELALFCKSRSK